MDIICSRELVSCRSTLNEFLKSVHSTLLELVHGFFEVAASFQVETANITHVGDAACARFHSEKEPILATSWL